MAQVVFGSCEAQAVLEKDRPLRKAAARQAAIEEARRTGRIETFEVFIEEYPPPSRSVIIKAYSHAEAKKIVEKQHLGIGEIISEVQRQ